MSEGHPPTKHAKDWSNSAALLASRWSRRGDAGHGGVSEGCSSEKDSGYSDTGSDRLQRASVGPGEVPAGADITPVYIIQNLMLPQDRVSLPGVVGLKADVQPTLWTDPTGGSGGTSAAQVLLLQQTSVVSPRPPLAPPRSKPRTHVGHMGPGTGRSRPTSYLRIAPRPGRTAPASPAPLRGSPAGAGVQKEGPAAVPLSAGERLPSPSSSCVSSSSSSSSSSACRDPRGLQGTALPPTAAAAARYHHFLHTMRALKRSGLLDLTLRTQELLRRSAASGRAVGQLGRHARLLAQLARRPEGGDPAPWESLHQAMARSGGYPSLKVRHQEPPSLGSPSPGPNQSPAGSEHSGSAAPPDSSTG